MMKTRARLVTLALMVVTMPLVLSCGNSTNGDDPDGPVVNPPSVQTKSASTLSTAAAALNGEVDGGAVETEYWFEWDTDPTLANPTASDAQILAAGSGAQTVAVTAVGLSAGTAYYYRLCARNSAGESDGEVKIHYHYANLVFLSSTRGTGDLESWAPPAPPAPPGPPVVLRVENAPRNLALLLDTNNPGDRICQGLARDAGLRNPEAFKAWLSDSSTDVHWRLAHSKAPYVRVDGVRVANDWADLTDGSLTSGIQVDESGQLVPGWQASAWTGTSGVGARIHCEDWTAGDHGGGTYGCAENNDLCTSAGHWTDTADVTCVASCSLYCFEQNTALPQEPFSTGVPGPVGWVWHVSACSLGLMQSDYCVDVCANFYAETNNCHDLPAAIHDRIGVTSCSYNTGRYTMAAQADGTAFTVTCELF